MPTYISKLFYSSVIRACFCVILVFFLVVSETEAVFNDVYESSSEYIYYLQKEGIVDGYSDGTFHPEQFLNRAEAIKLVVRATVKNADFEYCKTQPYGDVPIDTWYCKYVYSAKKRGIIEGYADGMFRPSQEINFVEFAKILAKAFNLETKSSSIWYKPYIEGLVNKNAILNYQMTFFKKMTRHEATEIVYRLHAGITNFPTEGSPITYDSIYVTTMREFYRECDNNRIPFKRDRFGYHGEFMSTGKIVSKEDYIPYEDNKIGIFVQMLTNTMDKKALDYYRKIARQYPGLIISTQDDSIRFTLGIIENNTISSYADISEKALQKIFTSRDTDSIVTLKMTVSFYPDAIELPANYSIACRIE